MRLIVATAFAAFALSWLPSADCVSKQFAHVEKVSDVQEFKKLLRTRTNVLILFLKNDKVSSKTLKIFDEAAEATKGVATIIFFDCSDSPKACKKLKVAPSPLIIQHYKDGEYNRDYDRPHILKSIISFLGDPTGDAPWDEEPEAADVVHIGSIEEFQRHLGKQKLPSLVMFYAPWCGYCKRLKPEFAAAATQVKATAALVGIDVDKPHLQPLRGALNITGFPTLIYFDKGQPKFKYGGDLSKDGIIKWLANPTDAKEEAAEEAWSDKVTDVVHLSADTFDLIVSASPAVLVMFYAPWCGHCKKMKPEYEEAAAQLKREGVDAVIAAVDATKEKELTQKFAIQGFPTVKYFRNGSYEFEMNERTADQIVRFMKDPKAPPPPPPPEPAWEEVESDVLHLTDDTFKAALKKKKHALVMFYAPWCGHCKNAKPHYTKAAARFKDDTKVAFAAVDCTVNTAVCAEYDVKGYPTFKYFAYGKNPQSYALGREEEDFVGFMMDPANPKAPAPPAVGDLWDGVVGAEAVVRLGNANFKDFVASNPSVLVMFYAPWCGHCKSMKAAYASAAADLKNRNIEGTLAAVDATIDRELAGEFDVRGFPTLKYFSQGEFASEFSERTLDKIVAFMEENAAKRHPPAGVEEAPGIADQPQQMDNVSPQEEPRDEL